MIFYQKSKAMKDKFKRVVLLISMFLLIIACSKDDVVYKLSTIVSPLEGGSISPLTLSESYDSGTEVTLTATPAADFEFVNWTGGASGTDYSVTIIMDSDKSVTAIFEKKDTDQDGVTDDIDECPDTPTDTDVDDVGCVLYLPDWHYNCYAVYDSLGYYLYDDCYWEYY